MSILMSLFNFHQVKSRKLNDNLIINFCKNTKGFNLDFNLIKLIKLIKNFDVLLNLISQHNSNFLQELIYQVLNLITDFPQFYLNKHFKIKSQASDET